MELFDHQKKLLEQNPATHLLAWGTGTGKTRTAIELALRNAPHSYLVICPKGLKKNWERETKKWGIHFFDREAMMKGSVTFKLPKIVSKEEFRRDWNILQHYECVIMDEMHTLAGKGSGQRLPGAKKRMGSQLHQAAYAYMDKWKVKYRYGLTATPFLRDAWNIFLIGRLLGTSWNYYEYRNKFFYERYMGLRTFWDARPGMQLEVAQLVHQLGSTVKLDECVDIPEATFETEYFQLTKEQRAAIKEIKEPLAMVRFMKHHQICGGALKGNEYEPTAHIKSDKVDRVVELCAEHDKLIISCCYLAEMEMLRAEIRKHNEVRWIGTLDGSVNDKQEVIDKFNKSTDGILIVNAKCSEGWQAPSAQVIVFYSYDFSLKNKIQMEGRIRRIDHPQKCTYIALVCEGVIDEAVVKALNRKEDFDIAIYNYEG